MSTQKEKYVLAIDIGTSTTKSALVSVRGEVVDMESEKNRLILLAHGGAEQDPDQWWSAIAKTCKRLIAGELVSVDDIVAVSCTGQWSGTVAVDKDGRHLECRNMDGFQGTQIHQRYCRRMDQIQGLWDLKTAEVAQIDRRGAGPVRQGPHIPHTLHKE